MYSYHPPCNSVPSVSPWCILFYPILIRLLKQNAVLLLAAHQAETALHSYG
jgi:hypothetical protein